MREEFAFFYLCLCVSHTFLGWTPGLTRAMSQGFGNSWRKRRNWQEEGRKVMINEERMTGGVLTTEGAEGMMSDKGIVTTKGAREILETEDGRMTQEEKRKHMI